MRVLAPLTTALLAVSALTGMLSSAASGKALADDVSIKVFQSRFGGVVQDTKTRGLNFQIILVIDSAAGVRQAVTVRIALPPGLAWGSDGPDPSEGCTGTAPPVCTGTMEGNAVGTVGVGWGWDVRAERAGIYDITATVEASEPDPDLSNNSSTFRIEVIDPAASGRGGSPTAVTASKVRLTPAKPRAGSLVAATVRVSAGGAPVKPARLTCAAIVGGVKLSGTSRARAGTATCLYRPQKRAKGQTLRGTIAFTARGDRITRRFATRLG